MARGGFLATTDGFAFTNTWPKQPAVVLDTPFGSVDIGDASKGLCGGMAFAALDYWYADVTAPTAQPALGVPLYSFLVARIVDSWHVPAGVAQYFQLMNVPDGDQVFRVLGQNVLSQRGLSWRTVVQQWPMIKEDLDAGRPCPLGLVTVRSSRIKDL